MKSKFYSKEPVSNVVIRFQDCDPFGHLNNARYIDYFINAREGHLVEYYNLDIYERQNNQRETGLRKQIYKERSCRVEPMQGLVKDIFELDYFWMQCNAGNRWLFAAMGLTIQMHQLEAYRENQSTCKIITEVLE